MLGNSYHTTGFVNLVQVLQILFYILSKSYDPWIFRVLLRLITQYITAYPPPAIPTPGGLLQDSFQQVGK